MEKPQIDELKDIYRSVLTSEVEDNWIRGDIAAVVVELNNEEIEKTGKSNVLNDFLEDTGESKSAFMQYKWVASVFDTESLRSLPVTWTHYRVCAGIADRDEAIDYLKRSSDEGWSCAKLLEEIKGAKMDNAIANGLECSCCNKAMTKEFTISMSISAKGIRTEKYVFCSLECLRTTASTLSESWKLKDVTNV